MERFLRLGFVLFILSILALLISLGTVFAEFGTNWTAQFYNCINLSCAVDATEVYPSGLNFVWEDEPEDADGDPIAAIDSNDFGARFTSTQSFVDGTYEFRTTSNDGLRLYVDGVLIIDQFVNRSTTTDTVFRTMTAGSHTLVVEFYNDSGTANLQVQWFFSSVGTLTPVVTSTPIPPITAQVESVNGLSLRTGPYLGASLINVLRPGNTYNVYAKSNAEGLFTWYQVTTASGQTGWASGRYLELSVEDDSSIPEVSTVFETLGGSPNRGVIAVPRAIMNVRVRPSTRTGRITQMPWGGEAELLARTVQGGKDFWYLVRWGDVVGWIYAPFVGVRGDINNVPVY